MTTRFANLMEPRVVGVKSLDTEADDISSAKSRPLVADERHRVGGPAQENASKGGNASTTQRVDC